MGRVYKVDLSRLEAGARAMAMAMAELRLP
jgi:hypothetical protein